MLITTKKHKEILAKYVNTIGTYSEENYYLREENKKLKKQIKDSKPVAKKVTTKKVDK